MSNGLPKCVQQDVIFWQRQIVEIFQRVVLRKKEKSKNHFILVTSLSGEKSKESGK